MLGLAVVICERGPTGTTGAAVVEGGPVVPADARAPHLSFDHSGADHSSAWQAEARFMIANADELLELLAVSGVADREHPPHLSTLVSADLLFEDGDIMGRTWLARGDLARLLPHAAPEMRERIAAWDAFSRALEDSGHASRLIVWFIR